MANLLRASLPRFPGELTPTSLRLEEGTSYEEWEEIGKTLLLQGRAIAWRVGDWYLFGERTYGERAAQAIGDETGYAARTVQNVAWVAGRFDPARRRENVDFGIHAALAGVEDDGPRHALLERADKERWTRAQAREAVRVVKGTRVLPAPGERTVETPRLVLAWYPEAGLLVIQDRTERRCGVTIATDDLTEDVRGLLRDVLRYQGAAQEAVPR